LMCSSAGEGEKNLGDGIITGHAYSVISLYEFEHEDEQVRLLKLRNPWGQGEWTGDWSDKSPLWTEELKQKLSWSDNDDGMFFIPFEAYLNRFVGTSACADTNPDKYTMQNTLVDLNGDSKMAFFHFTLTEDYNIQEDAFGISAAQQGPRLEKYRLLESSGQQFRPSDFNIVLARLVSENQYEIVQTIYGG